MHTPLGGFKHIVALLILANCLTQVLGSLYPGRFEKDKGRLSPTPSGRRTRSQSMTSVSSSQSADEKEASRYDPARLVKPDFFLQVMEKWVKDSQEKLQMIPSNAGGNEVWAQVELAFALKKAMGLELSKPSARLRREVRDPYLDKGKKTRSADWMIQPKENGPFQVIEFKFERQSNDAQKFVNSVNYDIHKIRSPSRFRAEFAKATVAATVLTYSNEMNLQMRALGMSKAFSVRLGTHDKNGNEYIIRGWWKNLLTGADASDGPDTASEGFDTVSEGQDGHSEGDTMDISH